jgi:NADPH:quinone reductase-like Zn-dependent oxidoreductase
MIVGDPPVVVGFEGVGEIEELGPGVTGFSVGERVCTCLPPIGAYSQERLYPADKLIEVPKDLPLKLWWLRPCHEPLQSEKLTSQRM